MTELATIKTKPNRLKTMLRHTALKKTGDPPWVHSKPYLSVSSEGLTTLAATSGGSLNTYHSFGVDWVGEITGSAEAILNVERLLDVLEVVGGDDWMELTLLTDDDGERAESVRLEGALNGKLALPKTDSAYEDVPSDMPDRWNDEEQFLSPSGNTNATFVQTSASALDRIVDAVDLSPETDYFPVSVEDGEFRLAVNEDSRDGALYGDLAASAVRGEDVTNHYSTLFEYVADDLSGMLELQTSPADPGVPLAVVSETEEYVLRHVLIHVNPQ